MYRKLLIAALIFLLPLNALGQKKKKRTVKKPIAVVVEEPQEDPRLSEMRAMTQQIVFIDSLVTDKNQFLNAIHLTEDMGRITLSHNTFPSLRSDSSYAFVNAMSDKLYFTAPDQQGLQKLYSCDKMGEKWSEPVMLTGLYEGLSETAFPFMLNDGITFYFAAKGEESIGGYDIFLTRYDSRSSSFLKPENVGMPFNSEANDYLMVINEADSIGYFVSDRRQPEGKVCIYTFIPADSRHTYNTAVYGEEQIRSLSEIRRISDTWGDGMARKAAFQRLQRSLAKPEQKEEKAAGSLFVVNDGTIYALDSDFRTQEGKKRFAELRQKQGQLDNILRRLNESRLLYSKASATDKTSLTQEILRLEQDAGLLYRQIRSLEKRIRKAESGK